MNMKKMKRNSGAETDNDPVLEDCEHKLEVKKYTERYKIHKGEKGVGGKQR